MKTRYNLILLTYIGAQFLPIPIVLLIQAMLGKSAAQNSSIYIQIGTFVVATIVTALLLRNENEMRDVPKMSVGASVLLLAGGWIVALFGQGIAAMIEQKLFGISAGSENTEQLLAIADITPLFYVLIIFLAPFLEEVVFRKVIFGSIYKVSNFWIAASCSSLAFSIVHFDFSHLLIYFTMGFIFAALYTLSGRLWVAVGAHMLMNGFVVLAQQVLIHFLPQQ
ncbi:MAG: lysostaphin resistance A-like protein [Bacilli bacterium]